MGQGARIQQFNHDAQRLYLSPEEHDHREHEKRRPLFSAGALLKIFYSIN